MRELIQRLVEAETEAKGIVATARGEAGRIIEAAQKEAQELTARSRRETRSEAEAMIITAAAEAGRAKQECLAQAKTEIENRVRLDEATTRRLVEAVVRVCGGQ